MASIHEIGELVWRSLFPNASAQSAVKKEEVIASALTEYASAMWIFSKELQATEGEFEIPSSLLVESDDLPVNDNMIDISSLPILRTLSMDQGVQDIGGFNCPSRYVKSTRNMERKLEDDDSLGDRYVYFLSGKKIMFPRGTHAKKLSVTYVSNGEGIGEDVEVNEYVGAKVRDKLYALYGSKQPADHTSNSNSNT